MRGEPVTAALVNHSGSIDIEEIESDVIAEVLAADEAEGGRR